MSDQYLSKTHFLAYQPLSRDWAREGTLVAAYHKLPLCAVTASCQHKLPEEEPVSPHLVAAALQIKRLPKNTSLGSFVAEGYPG